MSIHSDSDSMTQSAKAGADDFLVKPIDPDDLYPSIRSVVTGYGPMNSDFDKILNELCG
jgi:DNA-binding response OmpR family regulator